MLEESSSHSISDIENSITNSLIIEREDDNKTRICKEICKIFCLCVVSILCVVALVVFFITVIFK